MSSPTTFSAARDTALTLYNSQVAELDYCHQMALRLRVQITLYEGDAEDPEIPRNYLATRVPDVLRNHILDALLVVENYEYEIKLVVLRNDLKSIEIHIREMEGFVNKLKEALVELYGEF